ncbi:MAG: TerB family tellurite resistance protein [Steroidobacteraceae bacterium]
MIANLKKMFEASFGNSGVAGTLSRLEPIPLLTATLLIELTYADFNSAAEEVVMAKRLLASRFGLDEQAVHTLVEQATARAQQAVSLHEFTHRLNQELTPDEKASVIEMLWRLSFADERLDKHEEQLIRRVAGLLHVPDRELLRLREKVRGETGAQ